MSTKETQPNAQKWTKEIVAGHLDEIEKEAREGAIPFLGLTLRKRGLRRHVWSYWKRIFAEDDDMLERMLLIDGIFECKVLEMGLHNQLDPVIATRTLKFVYKWGKGNGAW